MRRAGQGLRISRIVGQFAEVWDSSIWSDPGPRVVEPAGKFSLLWSRPRDPEGADETNVENADA